jgi:hypothetical protein
LPAPPFCARPRFAEDEGEQISIDDAGLREHRTANFLMTFADLVADPAMHAEACVSCEDSAQPDDHGRGG